MCMQVITVEVIRVYNGIEYDSFAINFEVKRRFNEMLNEQIDGVIEAVYQQEEIISIVKSCTSMEEVFEKIQDRFGLSEVQTKTILDIPLSLLSQLDIDQLESLKIEMHDELLECCTVYREIYDSQFKGVSK